MQDEADAPPVTYGDSRVTMFKVVTATLADARNRLEIGCLLQFMDIAACLSAEQHSKLNCVTLSMDDLHFEHTVPLGVTVRLDAQINKVFGSSMEVGVSVCIEPQCRGQRSLLVCTACFIFVALRDGKPAKVPPAIAATMDERHAAALAEERKKVMKKRLQLEAETCAALQAEAGRAASVDNVTVVEHPGAEAPATSRRPSGGTSLALCQCFGAGMLDVVVADPTDLSDISMAQLVLPNHANHHGNTFGGQLMSWMAEAATVAASRQARKSVPSPTHVKVAIFDAMKFIAPSKVGDRVRLRGRVTRVFEDGSMEIGVDVASAGMGSEDYKPINSGYLTVSLVEMRSGQPVRLQASEPPAGNDVGKAQHDAAMLRRQLRIQRRQMFSLRPDAMHFAATLLGELRVCNVMSLLRVAYSSTVEWEPRLTIGAAQPLNRGQRRGTSAPNARAPAPISVFLSRNTLGVGTSSFKVIAIVHAPITEVFTAVSDYTERVKWDSIMASGHVHRQLDEHSSINYLVVNPLARGVHASDYALVQSWQKDDQDGYVIASRSVITNELPPVHGLKRGTLLPSGFLLEAIDTATSLPVSPTRDGDGASTRLTYVAQMPLTKGITGATFVNRIIDHVAMLMVNRFVRLQCQIGRGDKAIASTPDAQQELVAQPLRPATSPPPSPPTSPCGHARGVSSSVGGS